MSGLMSPLDILDQIASRIADTPPLELLDKLMPVFRADAVSWARRLALWDDYRGRYPDQVVGLARVVSRRAMREFGLTLTEDGRVVERDAPTARLDPKPEWTFTLLVAGQDVQVEYTPSYFPARDSLAFWADANPLSDTGYWHVFAPTDAVAAVGGPKAFAILCAEAKMAGCESELMERLEGRLVVKRHPRKRSPHPISRTKPVLGAHTAAVTDARQPDGTGRPSTEKQGELF